MNKYIKRFNEVGIKDIPEVGGKNASLGEMFNHLTPQGIAIPNGFAVTASAFRYFIEYNKLDGIHSELLAKLDRETYSNLHDIGQQARELILTARMPDALSSEIHSAYLELSGGKLLHVAVRSSATAEDLPEASFAGQHESFLNIQGADAVAEAVKKCFASLYTDRAIKYREDNNFDHSKVFLSVGVQRMIRSDLASSGIGFTLDPESGFRNVIHLAGVWGLGETIVQGQVTPDEFTLFKPALKDGKKAILEHKLGKKLKMMIYAEGSSRSTMTIDTPDDLQEKFVLNDDEITTLGNWALGIEEYYKKPMDIEWAKDGESGELFILQARPETVHSRKRLTEVKEFKLLEKGQVIVTGDAIGSKIVAGVARVLSSTQEADKLLEGEILVTEITSPDWDPIFKKSCWYHYRARGAELVMHPLLQGS